jgi:hypothetical protein
MYASWVWKSIVAAIISAVPWMSTSEVGWAEIFPPQLVMKIIEANKRNKILFICVKPPKDYKSRQGIIQVYSNLWENQGKIFLNFYLTAMR